MRSWPLAKTAVDTLAIWKTLVGTQRPHSPSGGESGCRRGPGVPGDSHGPVGMQHLTAPSTHPLSESLQSHSEPSFKNFITQCLICSWGSPRETHNCLQLSFSGSPSGTSSCYSHRHQDQICWSSQRNIKAGLLYNKAITILHWWLFVKDSEDVKSNISTEW